MDRKPEAMIEKHSHEQTKPESPCGDDWHDGDAIQSHDGNRFWTRENGQWVEFERDGLTSAFRPARAQTE